MSRNDVMWCVKRRALAFVQVLAVGVLMMVGFYAFAALGHTAGFIGDGVRVEEACRPGKDCTLDDM